MIPQELANDGNYRETRYFATWKPRAAGSPLEDFVLPKDVAAETGQDSCPFGHAVLQVRNESGGNKEQFSRENTRPWGCITLCMVILARKKIVVSLCCSLHKFTCEVT
jgi:hypothetical protein